MSITLVDLACWGSIHFWDKDYEASETHDFIETAAWEARHKRLRKIALELIALIREENPAATRKARTPVDRLRHYFTSLLRMWVELGQSRNR